MKILLTLISVCGLFINSYAQIQFEKGYYINNSSQKINCLIQNDNWKNTPTEFTYKQTDTSEFKTITIRGVKEFSIAKYFKYLRNKTNFDRTNNASNALTSLKAAELIEENVFLKVLIDGEASLFSFEDSNATLYFFKTGNSEIQQLTYKKYLNASGNVAYYNLYKQQLWEALKCPDITSNDIEKLSYRKKDLIKLFETYNKSMGFEYDKFEKKKSTKEQLNLSLRTGLNLNTLHLESSNSANINTDFNNQTSLRIGIELEYFVSRKKNNWSLFLEPNYNQFKGEKELYDLKTSVVAFDDKVTVDYSSIQLPFGIRHYIFLSQQSKLFLNAALVYDFVMNSKVDFEKLPDLEIDTNNNIIFGLGYKYNDKYGLELRYGSGRNLLAKNSSWNANFNTFSIILAYYII